MRIVRRSFILAALFALLATPSMAAEPQKPFILDLNDPTLDAEESAFWSDACGFPVTAELSGHIIFHNPKRGAVSALAVYHIGITLTSQTTTVRVHDVGPDLLYTRNGVEYSAAVGRSITGSGVIGRAEMNVATGEVEWHGRLVGDEVFGDFTAPTCRALAPAS